MLRRWLRCEDTDLIENGARAHRLLLDPAGGPDGNTTLCAFDDRADLSRTRAYTEKKSRSKGEYVEKIGSLVASATADQPPLPRPSFITILGS
jgi:hypothetical protein